MGIPLCPAPELDRPIWHFSPHGRYTVKSAYKMASALTLDLSYGEEGSWIHIWKIPVLPKVKSFLWRAVKNNLPSKENLLSRGILVGGECGTCKMGYENLWHVFFACPFAEECWRIGGLSTLLGSLRDRSDSFKEALSTLLSSDVGASAAKVSMILWHVRKDRNKAVWEGAIPNPSRTVTLAASCREDWLLAQAASSLPSSTVAVVSSQDPCVGWHNLQEGWVYVVWMPFFSQVMALWELSMKVPGRRGVDEGELMGIKEALSWLKVLGFGYGWIECDSKIACDAITKQERVINEKALAFED
ncbi:uncharacterized protein LOC131006143 [Salvia miltiorrhiza]|uniref:uncharacterized protein LOC131006143 n=1 Tax=Salvia miltiorrhiza TaxID=226208 RepID=UPI0025AC95C2|nr:uncharacterized protein LOC131006143 [Salvia miltiorrhiza]